MDMFTHSLAVLLITVLMLSQVVATDAAPVEKRIDSIGDGRLCIGNGYWLASFVGPIEEPEKPIYQVHDKISRLWLGYSSPQLQNVGMAPRIKDLKTGKEWGVGACDSYKFEDGVIVMETAIPPGTVRTETYGLWDKPVLARKITFTPKKGSPDDYEISVEMSLFKGSIKKTGKLLELDKKTYEQDERERPPFISFPLREEIHITKDAAVWSYEKPHYRKAVIGAVEPKTKLEIIGNQGKSKGVFESDKFGSLRLSCKGAGLTIVLAFDKDLEKAKQLLGKSIGQISARIVRNKWRKWFESGAVITTGNKKLDAAYRNEMMYIKIAQDAELGGMIVGARYQITTVWTRDAGVGIAALLDAGHYEEARKALRFFSKYQYWNERNHCMNANSHASGRTSGFMCGPGQEPVDNILHDKEWHNIQMLGPQLDGNGYYLYNIAKYYRCTGDKQFIQEEWPFIIKVADALAADNYIQSEGGPQGEFTDKHLRFKKYNPETGLIVDNCGEDGVFREHLLTNALAAEGFKQAHWLSEMMGEAVPLWNQRSEEIDAAIMKNLLRKDDKGEYLVEWVKHPWVFNGTEAPIGGGYAWTHFATIPHWNYKDKLLVDQFHRFIDPKGDVGGWGMWFATLAHAAFQADWADCGWNYISKLLDQLPESLQLFEHNQDVTGDDGVTRHVTLNLFGYSYLPHALIRGFAGFGYDEKERHYFFRPQIPDVIGTVKSRIMIGNTSFDVTASGNGSKVVEFKVDGVEQALDGILDKKYLNGKRHEVVVRMGK